MSKKLIDELFKHEANTLKIKSKVVRLPKIQWIKQQITFDLIPNSLGWSMRVIGKTGSGKTTFVSAFVDFFLNHPLDKSRIDLISPTSNEKGWDRIRDHINILNSHETIKDISNALIICDDTEILLKGDKTLIEMILNKRHMNISIIQCKQYAQNTDLIQKMNADYYI